MKRQSGGGTVDAFSNFVSHVCTVSRVYWWDAERPVVHDAWARLAAVLALQVVRSKASAWLSWTTRAQLNAWGSSLTSGQGSSSKSSFLTNVFTQAAGLNILVVTLNVVVDKLYRRILLSLRMRWAKCLTKRLLEYYLKLNGRENSEDGGLDRTEQHLAYDVDKVCGVHFLHQMFNRFFTMHSCIACRCTSQISLYNLI
jgi:ABC-type uncharacterized transport system fused permease/ATPase subunit